MRVVFIGLLFLSGVAHADWLSVEDLSLDYIKYFNDGRAPLVTNNGLPDKDLGSRLGLNLTLSLPATFYWFNRIESYADHDRNVGDGQFRSVSWELELGARFIPQTDVFYHHRSQHVLDHAYDPGYPCEDGVGVRFHIVGGQK